MSPPHGISGIHSLSIPRASNISKKIITKSINTMSKLSKTQSNIFLKIGKDLTEEESKHSRLTKAKILIKSLFENPEDQWLSSRTIMRLIPYLDLDLAKQAMVLYYKKFAKEEIKKIIKEIHDGKFVDNVIAKEEEAYKATKERLRLKKSQKDNI